MRLIPQKPHVVVIVELLIHRSKARSELCQRRSVGFQWMETTTFAMEIAHTLYCLHNIHHIDHFPDDVEYRVLTETKQQAKV